MLDSKIKKKFKIIQHNNDDENITETITEIEETNKKLINEYIESLDKFELQAMNIAKRILESSFDLEKSIGFLNFKKSKNL